MKRFIIEREIPGIGGSSDEDLKGTSAKSCDALRQVGPEVQWEHSYIAGDKTFCVYLAENEDAIRRHAEISGFPANRITPVEHIIDPVTAG